MSETAENSTQEPATEAPPEAPEKPEGKPAGDEGLNEGGKKALERMKLERKAAMERAEKAEAELAEIRHREMRSKVTADLRLKPEVAEFLQGETEEELTAYAERLKAAFTRNSPGLGPPVKRPQERLRSGASSDDGFADVASIADKIAG